MIFHYVRLETTPQTSQILTGYFWYVCMLSIGRFSFLFDTRDITSICTGYKRFHGEFQFKWRLWVHSQYLKVVILKNWIVKTKYSLKCRPYQLYLLLFSSICIFFIWSFVLFSSMEKRSIFELSSRKLRFNNSEIDFYKEASILIPHNKI